MGIFILCIVAFGIFVVLRATLRALLTFLGFFKRPAPPTVLVEVVADNSALDEAKSVWGDYETPAFIRRGIGYPVLREKKAKRVRKVKLATAPLPEMALAVF